MTFLPSGDCQCGPQPCHTFKASPLADVFYGMDNTFLCRALNEDISNVRVGGAGEHPRRVQARSEFRALPFDYGDVCINYDIAYFEENNLPVPQSLEELTDPQYNGLLVVENPATSSPGWPSCWRLSPILARRLPDYWTQLLENGAVVVND